MSYVYQPFPRMLYRGEDQRIVANHDEELDAIKDGWHLGPTEPVDAPVVEPESNDETAKAETDDPVHATRKSRGRPRKVTL